MIISHNYMNSEIESIQSLRKINCEKLLNNLYQFGIQRTQTLNL